MNHYLSVILKDFLVVPDEVVNGLNAGMIVVVSGWEIEIAKHIPQDGYEQLLKEIGFHSSGYALIAGTIILIVLQHQV